MPAMKLKIIPISEVENAQAKARESWIQTDKFNTAFHSHEEISKPDLTVEHLSTWVDLIMSTQGAENWHIIE